VNKPRLIFWLLESAFQASVIPVRKEKGLANWSLKALDWEERRGLLMVKHIPRMAYWRKRKKTRSLAHDRYQRGKQNISEKHLHPAQIEVSKTQFNQNSSKAAIEKLTGGP
jgi:hypothetical protein